MVILYRKKCAFFSIIDKTKHKRQGIEGLNLRTNTDCK